MRNEGFWRGVLASGVAVAVFAVLYLAGVALHG